MPPDMRRRVLVVDDDQDLRDVVAQILDEAGYAVTLAQNGVEALRAVEAQLPHLILLDMKMPVMDGWAFARELRSRWGAASPPLVVLTAAENPAARAADIDARGWLGKPFDIEELRKTLARALGE